MPSKAGASTFAADVCDQAAQILSRPPYARRPARSADPLGGVLSAIGRGFVWVFGHPARWLLHRVLVPIFHGAHSALGSGGWVVALVLALGLGVFVGVLLVRRRSHIASRPTNKRSRTTDEVPIDLERAAEEAEANGENELAVRLRFRYGLARLEAGGVISDRFTTTSLQLRRILLSSVFDELASRHESITYAQESASPNDVAAARDGWGQLLAEASNEAQCRENAWLKTASAR